MRKRQLGVLVLLFCASLIHAQEPCNPTETILLPPESVYEGCDTTSIASHPFSKGRIYKKEHKVISWPTTSKDVFLEGTGECAYGDSAYCDFTLPVLYEQWPWFLPPYAVGTYWEQKVQSRGLQCGTNTTLCPNWWPFAIWFCQPDSIGDPALFSATGVCPSSGGGGGGGGDPNEDPGGGCMSCGCYYQTVDTFVEDGSGDDCYYKYRRVQYICDGIVQSDSGDEYQGHFCYTQPPM